MRALVCTFLLIASVCNAAVARLPELKSICASLVGQQLLSAPWNQLRPYLRDKHALDSPGAICSLSCNGSIQLQDGYQLDYIYLNPQHIGWWKPNEAIVYSVTLTRGKKQIFHREIQPK